MTPAARLSAAMSVLDRYLVGAPLEQALTNWGRASRFAGSGDRHAVRDLVFDAVRCRRSFAAHGGGETGRGLILGGLIAAGDDPDILFTGVGHAPAVVTLAERALGHTPTGDAALDCPAWLVADLQAALGDDFAPVMQSLRVRAAVFLRANLARTTRDGAMELLAREGIATRPCALADTAIEVTGNARKVAASGAYLDGLVELQDAASQAVVAALDLRDGMRVLDYCAGGGGKSLAMAARARIDLFAHDSNPARLQDLGPRAARAGVPVHIENTKSIAKSAPYDLVLTDVPCSGSGAWRRSPEGKWALGPDRLAVLCAMQAGILDETAGLVAPGGTLAYVTCSMLPAENRQQVNAFLARHAGFQKTSEQSFSPLDGGDGFFLSQFRRSA